MILAVEIIGMLCMITFMTLAVWGFILLTKIYRQLQYKNYLMEKLNQNIFMLVNKEDKNNL